MINIEDVCKKFKLKKDQKIYFLQKNPGLKQVYEVVNELLCPLGFESYTEGQFKRIAGESSVSSNMIKNYDNSRSFVSNGYTYIKDILDYCNGCLKNSVFIPLDRVIEEFNWAKKAINQGFITLYSGGGKRYDIEAIIDITKGLLPEVAFEYDAKKFGLEIQLNREFYEGKTVTDEGQDVKLLKKENEKIRKPKIKIQIKDVQYFLLVTKEEFDGPRKADVFIGYKTHWQKESTAQRFFRSLGGKGEEIFNDFPSLKGIILERRGWAKREDFKRLPPKTNYKSCSFDNDNMYVYWEDMRKIDTLFTEVEL
jgi:hypothetical protein